MLFDGLSVKLSVMKSIQTCVSRIVRRYLADRQMSVTALAKKIGLSRPTLSARLSGATRWTIDDLEDLVRIGVPVDFEIFGSAIEEAYSNED